MWHILVLVLQLVLMVVGAVRVDAWTKRLLHRDWTKWQLVLGQYVLDVMWVDWLPVVMLHRGYSVSYDGRRIGEEYVWGRDFGFVLPLAARLFPHAPYIPTQRCAWEDYLLEQEHRRAV